MIENQLIETILKKIKFSFIYCNICGGIHKIKIKSANFREDCICKKCRSNTRKRHIAAIFLEEINSRFKLFINSLSKIPSDINLKIYNLESDGALHKYLKHTKEYVCSEYFGSYEDIGLKHNGTLNVDLMSTPFKDESFNYILSTEVFEHIPNPYKAFDETYRILKKGGAHIFTVPYYQDNLMDETRAIINAENKITYLLEPQYHGDPLRKKEGILVYTIFAKEMISKLEKIGFSVKIDHKINYTLGIIGANNYVFTAIKN